MAVVAFYCPSNVVCVCTVHIHYFFASFYIIERRVKGEEEEEEESFFNLLPRMSIISSTLNAQPS